MKVSTILKWITGGLEALLGIPILGGSIILSFAWTPLLVMGILHIVALIFSIRDNEKKYGNILGIVTSIVAWVPFLGMVMHIITAVLLLMDAAKAQRAQAY